MDILGHVLQHHCMWSSSHQAGDRKETSGPKQPKQPLQLESNSPCLDVLPPPHKVQLHCSLRFPQQLSPLSRTELQDWRNSSRSHRCRSAHSHPPAHASDPGPRSQQDALRSSSLCPCQHQHQSSLQRLVLKWRIREEIKMPPLLFQMSHLMFSPLYFKSTFYKVTSKCATLTDQPLRFYLSYQCLLGLFSFITFFSFFFLSLIQVNLKCFKMGFALIWFCLVLFSGAS